MKVLYVTNSINKGGVAKVVLGYAFGLCDFSETFSCDIVSFEKPEDDLCNELKKRNINVFVVKPISSSFLRFKMELRRILCAGRYDAIHCHIEYFNWIPCAIAKQCGIKIRVGHAHGQKGNSPALTHRIVEAIGRSLNRVYCNKRFACSNPSGKFVFGRGFSFLPNYVDNTDEIKEICKNVVSIDEEYNKEFHLVKKENLILGYMGYLGLQKNPFLAIKSVERLHACHPNVRLLIAGDGVDKTAIEEYIENHGCGDYIRLLGHRKDNLSLLKYFDALLMPSFSEGMSLALLEAQLLGTPCIVSANVPENNDLGFGLYHTSSEMTVNSFSESIELCFKDNGKPVSSFLERKTILEQKGYDKSGVLKALLRTYGECVDEEAP